MSNNKITQDTVLYSKFQIAQGSNVTTNPGNVITLTGSNIFNIETSTVTQIDEIDTTGWSNGSQVQLIFDGACTITHNNSLIKLVGDSNVTTNDGYVINLTLVDGVWLGTSSTTPYVTSSEVIYPTDGIDTHVDNLQTAINHIWSASAVDGFDLTENGDGTVTLTDGTVVLRPLDNHESELKSYFVTGGTTGTELPALNDNEQNFVVVNYNAGTPNFTIVTDPTTITGTTQVPLYVITRVGNSTHSLDIREYNVDYMLRNTRKSFFTEGFVHAPGGTIISELGTRNFSVTAGTFYLIGKELAHSSFDTSAADTFTYYSTADSGTTWTRNLSQSAINNTNYNDITSGLVTLGNNKFGIHWVFLIYNTPSVLGVLYGQEEYDNLDEARSATLSTTLPPELALYSTSVLIAKIIIEKSSSTFSDIQSPFGTVLLSQSPTVSIWKDSGTDVRLISPEKVVIQSDGSGNILELEDSIGNPVFQFSDDGEIFMESLSIFKRVTPSTDANSNFFFGLASTQAITTGIRNIAIGYDSGKLINSGNNNVLVGLFTGDSLTTQINNVLIGNSIESTGSDNTGIGFNVNVGSGGSNVVIGKQSGNASNSGSYNTILNVWNSNGKLGSGSFNFISGFYAYNSNTSNVNGSVVIGKEALRYYTTIGSNNIVFGSNTARGVASGSFGTSNVVIGDFAAYAVNNASFSYNVVIGSNSARDITSAVDNSIFIGRYSGRYATTANQLVITNQDKGNETDHNNAAIIYGEMGATTANQILNFNADTSVTYNFETKGGITRNVTTVNAATYNLLDSDDILNVTYTGTGAVTSLTLPTAQTVEGRTVVIKDAGGNAGTNNITVDTEGAQVIDGAATLVINTNYQSMTLYCDGSNWFII